MKTLKLMIPLAALVALLALSIPASAKNGNDGRVLKSGDCTGSANWKLKAKPDDGRLEVEFEVDQNRTGVKWDVRIRRNGRSVATGSRRTKAPSGSFSFERNIADPAGTDSITAVARRAGETCRGSLKI